MWDYNTLFASNLGSYMTDDLVKYADSMYHIFLIFEEHEKEFDKEFITSFHIQKMEIDNLIKECVNIVYKQDRDIAHNEVFYRGNRSKRREVYMQIQELTYKRINEANKNINNAFNKLKIFLKDSIIAKECHYNIHIDREYMEFNFERIKVRHDLYKKYFSHVLGFEDPFRKF